MLKKNILLEDDFVTCATLKEALAVLVLIVTVYSYICQLSSFRAY